MTINYIIVLFPEKYQKLESEKKNTRTVRKTHVGPMIRYQSLSMPVMVLSETSVNDKNETIIVVCDDDKNTNALSNNTSSEVKEAKYVHIYTHTHTGCF